jgi:hypothetical protein
MSRIFGIDPGNEQSGTVDMLDRSIVGNVLPNQELLLALRKPHTADVPLLAIEMIASYGMAVGKEVFDTVLWIGRFVEAWEHWGGKVRLVYRREVKLHLCESVRANDSNIRAALIDRYGCKEKAIGSKKAPGPLYGIKSHCWPALAVAITAAETTEPERVKVPVRG